MTAHILLVSIDDLGPSTVLTFLLPEHGHSLLYLLKVCLHGGHLDGW